MRLGTLVATSAILSVLACTDSNLVSPPDDGLSSGPSFAISDAGHGGDVGGFWFLPPLAKQVTTEGVFDDNLEPAMEVCLLDGNPSASANEHWEDVACASPSTIVTRFAAGTAALAPGSSYQFSWNTSPNSPQNLVPMNPDLFYRIHILIDDTVLGYLDVNPQHPSGATPGEDFDDLYAFRLGENLPVKFFATPQVRCSLGDAQGYVLQCVARGVIDQNGGVVTLEPLMTGWPTLSVVVPPGALPDGFPLVILIMERIDPDAFLTETGEECIPGLPGIPSFDAPQFGDCLRVTTDPELPLELDVAALIEMCVEFDPLDFPELKFLEEQDTRLQIIRFAEDETQGLPNVDATTCGGAQEALGFFPLPREDGFLRTAAVAANTVARWLGPQPILAHGAIRLAGATTEFSRFRWGLPGEMIKESGDGVIIQQLADGSESYEIAVEVKVVDAGSSTIEGATVHFSGDGAVLPTDVTTGSDGLAGAVWTVPAGPGVYTLEAKALGLLSTSVPDHSDLVDFEEATVTFSATVVPPCLVAVNGQVGVGEWDCALGAGDYREFTANISGGGTPAQVRWQQGADNLYFLVLVRQSSLNKVNNLRIDFDNTLNGASGDDDVLKFSPGGGGFLDHYLTDRCASRSQSDCSQADTGGGGQTHGLGALGNDGTWTAYELSHPLSSGDARDFDLDSGDPLGFFLTLSIGSGAQGNTQFPGFRQYHAITIR